MLKAENQRDRPIQYPDNLRAHIVELAQLCPPKNRDKNQNYTIPELGIKNLLEKIGKFYHDVVGVLGEQLQIEIDRGKSANRSDPEVVNACNTIIKCFDIAPWVEERKSADVYTKRDINIKGHGAINMMARMTNDTFAESAITPRSTQQFQDLFKGVEVTPAQKANAVQIKKIYDSLIHRAVTISREAEQSPGLKIVATNSQGQQIEIIGLAEKKHPNIFDDRKLDITVVENKSPYKQSQNKWIAIALIFDEDGKPKLKSNGQQQTKDTPQIESVKREEWEKQMLKQAIACLKENPANTGEEMQTATFGDGKYRVIYYEPSEMLRIVDEENHRGTLYKVQRGNPSQMCEFTSDEKRSFEQLVKLDKHLEKSIPKGLQRE